MDGGESTAAMRWLQESATRWSEPGFIDDELASMLTDEFEREDRRRLVGVPGPVGRAEYVRQQQTFFALGSGRPKIVPIEVLATCGERLVAGRSSIAYPDGSETQLVSIHQLDVACDRCELLIIFDPEDVDQALQELSRLARLIDS